jgi:hypothetical protein
MGAETEGGGGRLDGSGIRDERVAMTQLDRSSPDPSEEVEELDDDAIRALLVRLARPRRAGGHTVERAAILASGADGLAVLAWIRAHDGVPEAPSASGAGRGLHGSRLDGPGHVPAQTRRFILPAGAL